MSKMNKGPAAHPALWLLLCIVGLPMLSETIYTPALPSIAHTLQTSESLTEYTLTIYLAAFALGTLFWGILSDRTGRKPSLLAGIAIYLLGCIGCYNSVSIYGLLFSRAIQAFGGSTGSVLGQAICRDSFTGPERGKIYSIIGSALAFSPAIGPVMGGIITQFFSWYTIFLVLIILALFVITATYIMLPETRVKDAISKSDPQIFTTIITDKWVIACGILIACCNGIQFSYYAEGPFYLMNILELSPVLYGISFIGIAVAGMVGGHISHTLHKYKDSNAILQNGITIALCGSTFFIIGTIVNVYLQLSNWYMISITFISMFIMMIANGMIIPNTLAISLQHYKHSIGTAAAIFGCYYYALISLLTLGMGYLHNGTLIPMPCYFFIITGIMQLVCNTMNHYR